MAKLTPREAQRRAVASEKRRTQAYAALREGRFRDSGKPRSVRFKGEKVEISETELQWLAVRGHIRVMGWPEEAPMVEDESWLRLRKGDG